MRARSAQAVAIERRMHGMCKTTGAGALIPSNQMRSQ
jgi:hypothetical protein